VLLASEVIKRFKERGYGPYIGVPCSFLKPLINYVIDHEPGGYLIVNNEGEAVAIAAGIYLGGRSPVVMFQNSGLGNAVNPLTSLNYIFKIPVLLIVTWRGEPDHPDEPQHQLMGSVTERLLALLEIPYSFFPRRLEELETCLEAAAKHMGTKRTPYALIMRKDTLPAYELRTSLKTENRPVDRQLNQGSDDGPLVLRREAIATVMQSIDADTLVIATTGKTARELCEDQDRDANLYVVGSMGCASSIALGLALSRPERRIIVLDGDGAALMRLESLASVGHYGVVNLTHVILDNNAYESTGGQQTLSSSVNFSHLALACGYRTACSSASTPHLAELITAGIKTNGPHLIHFRVRQGSDPALKRPVLAPSANADRFRTAACASVPVGVLR